MGLRPSGIADEDESDDNHACASASTDKNGEHWTEKPFMRPPDHGPHAWLFLCAATLIEGLVFGFPNAYGVFQEYYYTHEPFKGSSGLPAVQTCALGVIYLGMPLMMGVQRLFPLFSGWSPLAGVLVMSLALLIASFSTTVSHLVATQGVLFAIGSSLSYCPCIANLNDWFEERKGVAYGIMWAGTGLSGSVFPFVLEYLLTNFGFRATLRICAMVTLMILLPFVYFTKPRIPPRFGKRYTNPFNFQFALSRTFILHQLANISQGLGFTLPSIYLPTYATTVLGVDKFAAASTILVVNVASVVGCPSMGWLSSQLHPATCLFIATIGASLATLVLWGLAMLFPSLLIFCAFYGLFAGSYTSAWTGIMRQFTSDNTISTNAHGHDTDPVMVISVLAAGRGLGCILSGPLSQALVSNMPWKGGAYAAYGTGYGPLILFTGATAAFGGLILPCKYMGWMR